MNKFINSSRFGDELPFISNSAEDLHAARGRRVPAHDAVVVRVDNKDARRRVHEDAADPRELVQPDAEGAAAGDDVPGREGRVVHLHRGVVGRRAVDLRCDEFCSSPDELSEARLRLYG